MRGGRAHTCARTWRFSVIPRRLLLSTLLLSSSTLMPFHLAQSCCIRSCFGGVVSYFFFCCRRLKAICATCQARTVFVPWYCILFQLTGRKHIYSRRCPNKGADISEKENKQTNSMPLVSCIHCSSHQRCRYTCISRPSLITAHSFEVLNTRIVHGRILEITSSSNLTTALAVSMRAVNNLTPANG